MMIMANGPVLRLGSLPMIAFLLARGEYCISSAVPVTDVRLSLNLITVLGRGQSLRWL